MNTSLVHQATGKIRWGYVLGYLLVFLLLPPVVGLPVIVAMVWRKSHATKSDYYLFFLCLAAYFAAINATKEPWSGGDQFRYYMAYLNVPKIGFWKSLIFIYGNDLIEHPDMKNISGEFMNGVYNYFGYYLTFGHYYLFAFFYTLIEYMLIFTGLYKYCQSLKKPHYPIICGVLILGFFYLFFQYTLHIQKQFFAQAIIMYVLGCLSQEMKMTPKLWVITAIALFTHSSTIIFIPFLAYGRLRQPLKFMTLMLLAGLFVALIFFAPSIMGAVSDVESSSGAMTYGLRRVARSEKADDGVRINMLQVIVVAIPMALIVLKQLWFNRRRLTSHTAYILNVVLLLLLAVAAMGRQPMAQYRYFMMVFAFMPFVYPHAFNDIKLRNFFLTFLSFFMIGWFYIIFEDMSYHFAPEWAVVGVPPVGLVFGFNSGV